MAEIKAFSVNSTKISTWTSFAGHCDISCLMFTANFLILGTKREITRHLIVTKKRYPTHFHKSFPPTQQDTHLVKRMMEKTMLLVNHFITLLTLISSIISQNFSCMSWALTCRGGDKSEIPSYSDDSEWASAKVAIFQFSVLLIPSVAGVPTILFAFHLCKTLHSSRQTDPQPWNCWCFTLVLPKRMPHQTEQRNYDSTKPGNRHSDTIALQHEQNNRYVLKH